MTQKQFNTLVEDRIFKIKETLLRKGAEYIRNNNPLHNFEEGSKFSDISREKVIASFALKHLISVKDIICDLDTSKKVKKEIVSEKIGDLINYLIILENSIYDTIDNKSINEDQLTERINEINRKYKLPE